MKGTLLTLLRPFGKLSLLLQFFHHSLRLRRQLLTLPTQVLHGALLVLNLSRISLRTLLMADMISFKSSCCALDTIMELLSWDFIVSDLQDSNSGKYL
jgi:hypothetical protein